VLASFPRSVSARRYQELLTRSLQVSRYGSRRCCSKVATFIIPHARAALPFSCDARRTLGARLEYQSKVPLFITGTAVTTHNDPFPRDPGRRRLFQAVGAAGVVATALPFVPAEAQKRAAPAQAYVFFNPAEATFIEAAVARLIPSDETGPGALEAGVPNYIDKQLGGAWGAGERLYRSGPWQQGAATQGYQLPFTPAELFRAAIRAINQKHPGFAKLAPKGQDTFIDALHNSKEDLGGVPSNVFFESLLELTIEGYFAREAMLDAPRFSSCPGFVPRRRQCPRLPSSIMRRRHSPRPGRRSDRQGPPRSAAHLRTRVSPAPRAGQSESGPACVPAVTDVYGRGRLRCHAKCFQRPGFVGDPPAIRLRSVGPNP
jgi:gluconate 2-dehydrogenase gamma chain